MLVLYKKKTVVVLHRKKMSFMLHMIMMNDESQQRLWQLGFATVGGL